MSKRQLVDDETDRQELLDRIAELEAANSILQNGADEWQRTATKRIDRIAELEASINQANELLFGTDEPLTNPVNIDALNELFCNLRKTLGEQDE